MNVGWLEVREKILKMGEWRKCKTGGIQKYFRDRNQDGNSDSKGLKTLRIISTDRESPW